MTWQPSFPSEGHGNWRIASFFLIARDPRERSSEERLSLVGWVSWPVTVNRGSYGGRWRTLADFTFLIEMLRTLF